MKQKKLLQKRNKKTPYGIFSTTKISVKDIDKVTSEWEKTIKEIGKFSGLKILW